MSQTAIWVVRVPKGQEVILNAKQKGIVAIGYAIQKDVSEIKDKEELKLLYKEERRDAKPGVPQELSRAFHEQRQKELMAGIA